MHPRRTLLAALFLLAPALPAVAAPQLSLTWNTCTGPTDLTTFVGQPYGLYASLTGLDVPTTAYEVWISWGDASLHVPDAWRFDDAGCQGSAYVTIDNLAPAFVSKACPSLQGSAQSLQIKTVDFWPAVFNVPTTLMRGLLANSYPDGNPVVNPSTRWFLARFQFDHTYSVPGPGTPNVTCGGFETPICFRVEKAGYLTSDGVEHFVGSDGSVFATFNGGAGCGTVPAQPSTWGDIKAQYRR